MTALHDETCSLLHHTDSENHPRPCLRTGNTPLPIVQLCTLCLLRLADPVAFTQIFPYVNEMIHNFGVAANAAEVGFYSGVVESLFAIAQLISIYRWSKLSDAIGRRPVILAGTAGIAFTSIQFGLSRTLPGVLLARFLAGIFTGNVAVMHSVLGELTDSTNQAVAFPLYGLCWPLGVIIGPLIGGTLASPADKPHHWLNTDLFRTFPYLLPCIVTALVTVTSLVVGFCYLDETLPTNRKRRTEKCFSILAGVVGHEDNTMHDGAQSTARSLLATPIIRAVCASGCALSLIGTGFDVVFVLFCYSPVRMGGLAYSASQIGCALAIAGLSSAAIQVFVMPYLLRTFNSARLYKVCMAIWPWTFIALPALNWLARAGLESPESDVVGARMRNVLWVGVGCALAMSRIACLAYSLNMILVKEYAPNPSSLGTANSLAQFSQCLARAVSPSENPR